VTLQQAQAYIGPACIAWMDLAGFVLVAYWVSSRWKSTPSRNGPINWRAFVSAA